MLWTFVTQSRNASFMASFRRASAGRDGIHLRAQHVHAEDVGLLALNVHRAHEDLARQVELRAHGCHCHPVLARARLGNDARLAHALGEQDLAQAVVDLVAARVVELVALEVDLRAALSAGLCAEVFRQAFGVIDRARAAGVMRGEVGECLVELGVSLGLFVRFLEIEYERHQSLGDEAAAVEAKEALVVRTGAERVGPGVACGCRCHLLNHRC